MNKLQLQSGIEALLERLSADMPVRYRHRGGRGERPDALLELDAGGRHPVRVAVEVSPNPRLSQLLPKIERVRNCAAQLGALPAIAVPVLSPSAKDHLRRAGVGYLSLDGHIYLKGDGVFIERQIPGLASGYRWEVGSSPYADRSSNLLRCLFSHTDLPSRIRELAGHVALSPGLVSRILSRLKDDAQVVQEDGRLRLADRAAVLADWLEFYRRRARRQEELRFYVHARDVVSILDRLRHAAAAISNPPWGLSFQAGASLIAPYAFFSEVHVLVGGPVWRQSVEALRRRLELEPAQEEANLILVRPYYKQSWGRELRWVQGLPVVSDVQLFLDLSVYPRRGAEQAERLRERLLSPGPPESNP